MFKGTNPGCKIQNSSIYLIPPIVLLGQLVVSLISGGSTDELSSYFAKQKKIIS